MPAEEGCQERRQRWRCRGPMSASRETGNGNWSHSSLGTSGRHAEDGEHDSLGMGLCTFDTELNVNVKGQRARTPG